MGRFSSYLLTHLFKTKFGNIILSGDERFTHNARKMKFHEKL